MTNEAQVSVAGYIATEPTFGVTRSGVPTLHMRLAWTPRKLDQDLGTWVDQASSFASVTAFRKIAENGGSSLRKGEPVIVVGTLQVREYEARDGSRRTSVDITANFMGHDLSRGVASFRKVRPQTEMTAAERQAADQALDQAAEPSEGWPQGPEDPADEMFDEADEPDEASEAEDIADGEDLEPAGEPPASR
jgi:single-strand DNA-binding protein